MIGKFLISIDYSTTCTGYAIFNLDTGKLVRYGILKPKVIGVTKLKYPKLQLEKIRSLAYQLVDLINEVQPVAIIVEEINRHKSRLAGKTLDGGHYIFLDRLSDEYLAKLSFIDSDGKDGWRSAQGLNLYLSLQDKVLNKERRSLNKKGKLAKKLPIITKKHLACRWVNEHYKLSLDCDKTSSDGDLADAIGIGADYIRRRC
ncbi:MAG: hypothetical protein DRP09_14060 [Candidatus Thorarchaeota archaeon]|nr:MAG: hypothetical protein DRP09_14060 [Candidatus Thorarchaeota archaeon]